MASKRTVNVYYSVGVLQTVAVLVPLYGRRAFAAACLFDPGRCKCFFESGLFWIKQGAVDCCRFRIGGFGDPIFLSFAVTALVFSCVGTIGEGALYSVLLLLSPYHSARWGRGADELRLG